MTFTVLRAADRRAVPWKNGGGVTREIAAWPPGSGFDDFAWRISMADVREDGPFSSFPGVDRMLMVLEGELRLTLQGVGVFDLSPCSAPLAFSGAAPVCATLTAGPVLDLNVMTRRSEAFAHIERVASSADIPAAPGSRLVFALADGVRVHSVDGVQSLRRHDALLTKTGMRVAASSDVQALVISLSAGQGPAVGRAAMTG